MIAFMLQDLKLLFNLLKVKVTNTRALSTNRSLNITRWIKWHHHHQKALVCSILAFDINPP